MCELCKEEDSVKREVDRDVKTDRTPKPPERQETEALTAQVGQPLLTCLTLEVTMTNPL